MGVVRAHDPHAKDTSYQVKTILGQMCDPELSIGTRRECVEKLTAIMQGMPMTEKTFLEMGINAKLVSDEKETTLRVLVPKEFVSAGITENRDSQWVVFHINRALNLEGLKNSDTAVITDLQGNPINSEEQKEK